MEIAQIMRYDVELPYAGGVYRLSGGRTYTSFGASIPDHLRRRHRGWGESTLFGSTYIAAHPAGTRAGIGVLAPELIGCDPRRVERTGDVMDRTLPGHHDARTALDVACWDASGRSVGLPVCELLGGSTGVARG